MPLSQSVTVPHWLSFDFPARWVRISASGPGFLGVATEHFDFDTSAIPAGGAAFYAVELTTTTRTPIAALQEIADNLPATARDISTPQSIQINGRPAATMTYTWTSLDGAAISSQLTVLLGPHNRFAMLEAMTDAASRDQFAPLLAQIGSTVTMHPMRPAPSLAEPAPIPPTYIMHAAEGQGYKLFAPRDWVVLTADQFLFIGQPGKKGLSEAFATFGHMPAPVSSDVGMPQLLDFAAVELLAGLVPDAVRISEVSSAAGDEQAYARVYFHGTVNGRPTFIVLGVVRRGAHQFYAIAFHHDPPTQPLPSLALQTLENVLASITIDPRLLPPGGDSTADWSPNGQRILFSSARQGLQQIYIMDASGQNLQPITAEPQGAMQGDWSPDGQRIAYTAIDTDDDALVIQDVDGGHTLLRYSHPDGGIAEPDWSPDSNTIAFTLRSSHEADAGDLDGVIYLLDLTQPGAPTARSLDRAGASPAWSPDGSRIAFVSQFEGRPELYVMNADGSDIQRLTGGPDAERYPAWSPDGSRLAFVRISTSGSIELYTIAADGSDPQRLTEDQFGDYVPAWSPDGARILFDSDRAGQLFLYTIPVAGGEVTRLSPGLP